MIWQVSTKSFLEEVDAEDQQAAWDQCLADKPTGWWIVNAGLICTAYNIALSEDEGLYSIHTAGLLLRYRLPELADAYDRAGIDRGLGSILHIYTEREGWLLTRAGKD